MTLGICAAGLLTRRAKVPYDRSGSRQFARRFRRTAAQNMEVALSL
jgi:hypothetical protein